MSINVVSKHETLPTNPKLQVTPEPEALLTVHEVAELLRVPVSWVYEHTRRRGIERLPHLKIGKYLRFRVREVELYVEGLRIE